MTQAYYRKTPQQALEAQNASAEGLSAQEARRRAEQYGPNKLSEGKKKSTLQVFLEQFKDLMVLILIIAAVISAFSGNVERHHRHLRRAGAQRDPGHRPV